MRNYIKITALSLMGLLASCTDVVDVEVQQGPTRLVIQASLDWEKGTTGNEQLVKLSTSTEFFDTTNNTAVTGASVSVTNDASGAEFIFTDQNNGEYTTTEFVPVLNQSYTLNVVHDGETYTAQETLMPVTDITDLYQDREDGFDDEELELHVEFTDPANEENYYFFKFQREGDLLPEFEVGDDEFVNGNEIDWWYELEEDEDTDKIDVLKPGDVVAIEMYGISEAYYDYMDILIDQIGGVDIFSATPVAVKGNCINLTNPDNYAHGYFRLTEVNRTSYTFE
ncbi:DUF4249 domain-containing protein [Zobellia sp. 1_MG-2023]|uniref:DUF4249 domain-containing protein n=1 Tax=Zobellia sp. 1_MG-2023 TaxID=3062626 RepID=UPI0026E1B122|nr:DUF4249 domain-containing protein [Zobellia sp. 1_MG-2023]MDO6820334.1 DUF4249 domain-containing protein [Zobellia sp. 1_MG-2023]